MAISWDTIVTIAITQAISTTAMFYTMKLLSDFHIEKKSKAEKQDDKQKDS
jgi:hypothetical protein